jgi:hypothetical protein
VSVFRVLAAAREAGVALTVDGDQIVARARKMQSELVEALKAVRPDLLRVLKQRMTAEAAFTATRPAGASEAEWSEALSGLRAFLDQGWADQALLAGWEPDKLFAVPDRWGRIDRCGAGLLIGRWLVVGVTAEAITVRPPWSASRLKFYRRIR